MGKLKVTVAFGGPAAEHDISAATGRNIFASLDREKYSITALFIDRNGSFAFGEDFDSAMSAKTAPAYQTTAILKGKADVVFNALHGPFGEDGTFQAFLKTLGIACTGSDHAASALGMDKMRSRLAMKSAGIPVPESVYVRKGDKTEIPFMPAVIKPNRSGSSFGTSLVKKPEDLEAAVSEAFKYDEIIIAEELLTGTEITCSVLQRKGKKAEALPVTLIAPYNSEFFDLKAKYEPGATDETTPAPIPDESTIKAQALAVKVHETIGCSGVTRTDMYLSADGYLKVLEINTLPGFTATSIVPHAAQVAGIGIVELCDILIEAAL
jgi:D-alanine-D-alanine ligase